MNKKNKQTEAGRPSGATVTSINTTYARACIILLACNFCITGYILLNVIGIQSEQSGSFNANVAPVTRTTQEVENKATTPLGVSPRVVDPGTLTLGTQETPDVEPGLNPR